MTSSFFDCIASLLLMHVVLARQFERQGKHIEIAFHMLFFFIPFPFSLPSPPSSPASSFASVVFFFLQFLLHSFSSSSSSLASSFPLLLLLLLVLLLLVRILILNLILFNRSAHSAEPSRGEVAR